MYIRDTGVFPNTDYDNQLYQVVRECYANSNLRMLSVVTFIELLIDQLKLQPLEDVNLVAYFCQNPEEIFQIHKGLVQLMLVLCFKSTQPGETLDALTELFPKFTWQRQDVVDVLAVGLSDGTRVDCESLTRFVCVMNASDKVSPFRANKHDLLLEYVKVVPEKEMILDVLEPLLCTRTFSFSKTQMLIE
jgi:hypothetical protein